MRSRCGAAYLSLIPAATPSRNSGTTDPLKHFQDLWTSARFLNITGSETHQHGDIQHQWVPSAAIPSIVRNTGQWILHRHDISSVRFFETCRLHRHQNHSSTSARSITSDADFIDTNMFLNIGEIHHQRRYHPNAHSLTSKRPHYVSDTITSEHMAPTHTPRHHNDPTTSVPSSAASSGYLHGQRQQVSHQRRTQHQGSQMEAST